MRANIYTLEPLAKDIRESIHYGIEMMAEYIGQTVATKELTVRLPQDNHGLVDPARVGLGGLDKLTELHLMAVPLKKTKKQGLGVASLSTGFAYIDTIECDSPELTKVVTAHESAHSLGFVPKGASHEDRTSPHHCTTPTCLMLPEIHTYSYGDPFAIFSRNIDLGQSRSSYYPHRRRVLPTYDNARKVQLVQHDFCQCCKNSMKADGGKNLARLRHNRLNMPDKAKITF